MIKKFSFTVKLNAHDAVQVIASEQMLSEAGKPMGNVNADITAALSPADASAIAALMVSLQADLEAQ